MKKKEHQCPTNDSALFYKQIEESIIKQLLELNKDLVEISNKKRSGSDPLKKANG